ESPNTLVTDIGVGKQQLVEIAKALSKSVNLLILDEPTASLNERDSDALLNLLAELDQQQDAWSCGPYSCGLSAKCRI
ncbi:ATP-binding cassette domain-containing protein, partial [Rhizobium ruizarguesonis]